MGNIYSKRFGLGAGSNSAIIEAVVPAGKTWILTDVDGGTDVDTAVLQVYCAGTLVWLEQAHISAPYTEVAASFRGRMVLYEGEQLLVEALGQWSAQASGYELTNP